MQVRHLRPADHADWLRLFRGYIGFYNASVPEPVIEQTWARCLGARDGFLGLVAVDAGGAVVGIANVLFHPSTWSATSYCYLEDLFVDPDRRAQGLGRALIEAVYREADARGATRTYWTTQAGNEAARALYDRLATQAPFVQYRR